MKRRNFPFTKAQKEAGESSSHSDEILKHLTNPHLKLRRLYGYARHALRSNEHVPEALAILKRASQSRELGVTQRDMALKILHKHERKGSPSGSSRDDDLMRLPDDNFWARASGCFAANRVEFIPREAWNRLNTRLRLHQKKWLGRSYGPIPVEHEENEGDEP